MKHYLTHNRYLWLLVTLFVVDGLFYSLSNPSRVASVWLIVGYCLFSLTVISLFELISKVFRLYVTGVEKPGRRIGRYSAALIVALVGLQSIGQLTAKDVTGLLPFVVLVYLYLGYDKTDRQPSR